MSPAKQTQRRRQAGPTQAEQADRHLLYQRAVQNVEFECGFIEEWFKRLRGRPASSLREDFCGTAHTACEWVRRRKRHTAIAVDLDGEVLAWAQAHNVAALKPAQRLRVELIQADVMKVITEPVDVVIAMNFSYQLFQQRAELRRYFKRVRESLGDDGIFFLDAYGGYDAYREITEKTDHGDFTYVWEQASYNPISGEMQCYIHFHFPDRSRIERAYSYTWRLWTLPELQEILREAGFRRVTVYWQGWDTDTDEGDGNFQPATSADADAGWISFITAEK